MVCEKSVRRGVKVCCEIGASRRQKTAKSLRRANSNCNNDKRKNKDCKLRKRVC